MPHHIDYYTVECLQRLVRGGTFEEFLCVCVGEGVHMCEREQEKLLWGKCSLMECVYIKTCSYHNNSSITTCLLCILVFGTYPSRSSSCRAMSLTKWDVALLDVGFDCVQTLEGTFETGGFSFFSFFFSVLLRCRSQDFGWHWIWVFEIALFVSINCIAGIGWVWVRQL